MDSSHRPVVSEPFSGFHSNVISQQLHTHAILFFHDTDPSGVGDGGDSVWGIIEGADKRYFEAEYLPKIRHSEPGLLSMVSAGENMIGSQFFITLGADLTSLDGVHCVIGQVVEGSDVLLELNEAICDDKNRPYRDIRITHTVILDDPFEDPRGFRVPSRSPSPSAERLRGGRIGADEEIDETAGKTEQEVVEMRQDREAQARATILEIIGDLPDAEIAPPENVLFVCKLNAITTDDDLEIIFSRFGKIKGCEVIRDRKSGDSLQYAFIEFEEQKSCEQAYFKMDNVLIDDRRIHVDFSQSVSRLQWRGKGRGLIVKDGSQNNQLDFNNYNKPIRANERNGRQDRDRNERDRNERDRNDRPNKPRYDGPSDNNRQEKRRSRSRSPNRARQDDRNRRIEPFRNDRRDDGRRMTYPARDDGRRGTYPARDDGRRDRRRSRTPDRHQPTKQRERKRTRSRSRSRDRSDRRDHRQERRPSPNQEKHKKKDKERKHKKSRRDSSSSSADDRSSNRKRSESPKRKRSESPKRKKSSKHKKDKKHRD